MNDPVRAPSSRRRAARPALKRYVAIALAARAALAAIALYATRVYTDQYAAEARVRHRDSLDAIHAIVSQSRDAVPRAHERSENARIPAAESSVLPGYAHGPRGPTKRSIAGKVRTDPRVLIERAMESAAWCRPISRQGSTS